MSELQTHGSNNTNEACILGNHQPIVHRKSTVKRASLYPRADVRPDHNLLVAVVMISLSDRKKLISKRRITLEKLRNQNLRSKITEDLNTKIHLVTPNIDDLASTWSKTSKIKTNNMQDN